MRWLADLPTPGVARRATIGLIWTLALWHSWESRALFGDGAVFLFAIVQERWFALSNHAREYAMVAGQIPVVSALLLGVTDLHWLARFESFGMFALPTALYHLALARAKDDSVLLAAVISAIAMVFMANSFHIVGEHNAAYALAILVAVRLATADRLRIVDGLMLVALSAFALRVYEAFVYLGPLLAVMVARSAWRRASRQVVAGGLHLLAAVLFLGGAVVAARSIFQGIAKEPYESAVFNLDFAFDLQFDLTLAAALLVAVSALLRPDGLLTGKSYRWARLCLLVLALLPLLEGNGALPQPFVLGDGSAHIVCCLVIITIVVFIWAYASDKGDRLKVLAVLRAPVAARRFLAFACLMLASSLPADVLLTKTAASYLEALRVTVRGQGGVIAFEDTPLSAPAYRALVMDFGLPSQSLALRSKAGDGIVLPPKDSTESLPFSSSQPPDLGRYFWRD